MKILPVLNYKIQLKPTQTQQQVKPDRISYTSLPSMANYNCEIMFGGAQPDLKKQLLSLEGVHCPSCGDEMVSEKTASEIIKKVEKARNLTEYADILRNSKKYFHPKYHSFINSLSWLAESYPEKSFSEAIKMLRAGSSRLILRTMHKQGEYLNELLLNEKFSDSDIEKIKTFADYLGSRSSIPKKDDYDELLRNTLKTLESEQQKKIVYNVNNGVMSAYNCRRALFCDPLKSRGTPEHVFVIKTMLGHSQNTLASIFSYKPDHYEFNNIMLCRECASRYKTFNYIANSPYGQDRLNQYAEDISSAIRENKLSGNNIYLYNFIGAVNGASGRELIKKRSHIKGTVQDKIFSERKCEYVFEQYEGIPCASCGTVMLTHDQKMKLYKDIIKCESIYELDNLVKLNSKYITPKYKVIMERFEELLKHNPDIEEKTILKNLQIMSKHDITRYMTDMCANIRKFEKKNSFNFIEKEVINDFLNSVKEKYVNMPPETEFRADDVNDLISKTLGTLRDPNKTKLINIAKDGLKTIYMKDLIVNPTNELTNNVGGELKAMFQNIFKMSVITVEHMEALALGGEDKYYNKIGCCKDCNSEKGRMSLARWAAKHPEVNENIPKHLKTISRIIKNENMKDMYNYPEQAAKQAIRLAKGKIHIPTDFKI